MPTRKYRWRVFYDPEWKDWPARLEDPVTGAFVGGVSGRTRREAMRYLALMERMLERRRREARDSGNGG